MNMAQDVDRHCRECITCQKSKLPMPVRSPLTNIPIGRPWQMIAIDILEVPVSTKNNRYLLVIQDYFTKWVDARPLPDQTAIRITAELVKLFCTYGVPEIVHSDQGRNFESSIVQSTLEAFGVKKSRTTPYHPQGDGMVERFNRSLLQLLRTYVERQEDWEQHLPLALYAYRTATHTSTGVSPFQLMYGRHSQISLPPLEDMKPHPTRQYCRQRWLSYRTLWRPTSLSLHTGRKCTMTDSLKRDTSRLGTRCGYQCLQQAN